MRITKKDVSEARRVYWLLLFSPFLNLIPFGQIGIIIYFVFLLVWSFSKKSFLKTHARAALLLLVLMGASGILALYFALLLTSMSLNVAILFLLIMFFLWFIGSLVGLSQAEKGKSWTGGLHAEIIESPIVVNSKIETAQSPALTQQKRENDVKFYLKGFRIADPHNRQIALQNLEQLGEVEEF